MTPATTWWAEGASGDMEIVTELISGELQDRNMPPIPANDLAEDLLVMARLIGAVPHEIKIWLSDRPEQELNTAAFRRWHEALNSTRKPNAAGA